MYTKFLRKMIKVNKGYVKVSVQWYVPNLNGLTCLSQINGSHDVCQSLMMSHTKASCF